MYSYSRRKISWKGLVKSLTALLSAVLCSLSALEFNLLFFLSVVLGAFLVIHHDIDSSASLCRRFLLPGLQLCRYHALRCHQKTLRV